MLSKLFFAQTFWLLNVNGKFGRFRKEERLSAYPAESLDFRDAEI
jgi:hypothetical protein